MAQLTFTGRSKDGKRLLLVDESGQEFTLAFDARLRSALTGMPERNGQLEIPMESTSAHATSRRASELASLPKRWLMLPARRSTRSCRTPRR